MAKFNKGDKVRIATTHGGSTLCNSTMVKCIGEEFIITDMDYEGRPLHKGWVWDVAWLELVTSETTKMSIKEQFITAFKSEPEKSFRQKGITNGDDMLTTDGHQIFMTYLLKKFGNEFKTEVVDKIEIEK